jgi:hypothetical protein
MLKSGNGRGNYSVMKVGPNTQKYYPIELAMFYLVAGAGLNFGRTTFK